VAELGFAEAIDRAVEQAMARDERIVVFGEDVEALRQRILLRHGPRRVRNTPISESAFLGAGVGAAMAGLKPVVEVMLVDFIAVALDPLLNHAAKLEGFSGGSWKAPLVVRAACGGGYGDGGQHEQCLWGMLAGIPGLAVVVPSNPADAAGLMLAALEHGGPVVYLEHKLLSETWLEYLGRGGRDTVSFDVPPLGARGEVAEQPAPVPLGRARRCRQGGDLAIVSLGVGVHRSLEAAGELAAGGIEAEVIDLRSVAPLDRDAILDAARAAGHVLVVDEDYVRGGLSGEIAALIAEAGIEAAFARVATEETIPYARPLEDRVLPSTERILAAARELLDRQPQQLGARTHAVS
jgi:pyruvate/2-oxoglutarate/acetoin dehydrogenase E1 component